MACIGALAAVIAAILRAIFKLNDATEQSLGLWLIAGLSVVFGGLAIRTEGTLRQKLAAGLGMLAVAALAVFAAVSG